MSVKQFKKFFDKVNEHLMTDQFLRKTKKLKAKIASEGFKVLRVDDKAIVTEKLDLHRAVIRSIRKTLEDSNKQG